MVRASVGAVRRQGRARRWVVVVAVVVTACGSGGTTTAPDVVAGAATDSPLAGESPSRIASGEGDPASGEGGGDDMCGLFTADEMASLLDRPAQTGEVGGPQDTLCQWVSEDGEADVSIQRVDDPDYWDPPTGDEGYVAINIAEEAYLVPWLDGRTAAAREGGSLFYVTMAPAPDDDEVLLDLLIEFMTRSSG